MDGLILIVNRQRILLNVSHSAPAALAKYIAHKVSITVDGTSLTVNAVNGCEFELAIVPHTLKDNYERLYSGIIRQFEVDLIARYLNVCYKVMLQHCLNDMFLYPYIGGFQILA